MYSSRKSGLSGAPRGDETDFDQSSAFAPSAGRVSTSRHACYFWRALTLLQYVAVCCSMLQCPQLCCSGISSCCCCRVCEHWQTRMRHFWRALELLQGVAGCCSVLQCVGVLQCVRGRG